MQRDPGGSPARDPARGRRWPDPARTDREVQVPPAAPPAELHLRAPRFRDRGVDAVRLGEGRSRATAAGRARDQGFCPRVARCAGATAPGSRSSTRKPLTAAARASYGLMSVMAMRSLSTSPSVAVAMARGCSSGTSRAPAGRRVRLAGDPESAAEGNALVQRTGPIGIPATVDSTALSAPERPPFASQVGAHCAFAADTNAATHSTDRILPIGRRA